MIRRIAPVLLMLVVAGCSGGQQQSDRRDPSKLDSAMETQARSLEARANQAAALAEREALTELERVEAEARVRAATPVDPTIEAGAPAASVTAPTPQRTHNRPVSS